MLLLLPTDPFRGMQARQKTMEPNFPGPEPEVVERQRAIKQRAEQRVCSWTAQNYMRSVLGRVPAGAARRFSILPVLEEEELNSRLCPLQRKRESTSSSMEIEGNCVSKNFNETVRIQSKKRRA